MFCCCWERFLIKIYDSVTAGFGIMGFDKNSPDFIASQKSKLEYRGLSYSIGGDGGADTMPNFINHFQPKVFGASVGSRLAGICTGRIVIYRCTFFLLLICLFVCIADKCNESRKPSNSFIVHIHIF